MNSTQLYDGILNGDVSCEHFLAFLHEKVQQGYVQGYTDACQHCADDSHEARNQFLSECG